MAYLDRPRLHFAGKFVADPSTIDNNPNDFEPDAPLSNDRHSPYTVGWNPQGTHTFKLQDCTVRGAVDRNGVEISSAAADPLFGARVESVLDHYRYPAKLVDLDVDQQAVSQVWGLQVRISIADPSNAGKVLASVTGEMPPTAFSDMWTRVRGGDPAGIPWFGAAFQSSLTNLAWVNPGASPLLAQIQQASPSALSLRLLVDSYQASSLQPNFSIGRLVGTIGPLSPNEPPSIVEARRLSAPVPATPGAVSPLYGAAYAKYQEAAKVLTVDLGNVVPTLQGTGSTVPAAGWAVRPSRFTLSAALSAPAGPSPLPPKATLDPPQPQLLPVASLEFVPEQYASAAGIVEIPLTDSVWQRIQTAPLVLLDETEISAGVPAVWENPSGLYVDVAQSFARLNPGESKSLLFAATRFGKPAAGVSIDLELLPQGSPDPNNSPASALPLPSSLVTDADGKATLTLTAADPGSPRKDRFLDGQLYFIGGPWTDFGNIYPLQSAPLTVLVFSNYAVPEAPTWEEHIRPIFEYYAKVYPYMKTILDLADYESVMQYSDRVKGAMGLPETHPHYMPVVRDLSAGKRQTIIKWLDLGMPRN
jgi:hypothetical protein